MPSAAPTWKENYKLHDVKLVRLTYLHLSSVGLTICRTGGRSGSDTGSGTTVAPVPFF